MVKPTLFFILLFLPVVSNAAEIQYRIDKSYQEVVNAIEYIVNEPKTVPFKVPSLPVALRDKDISVSTLARPLYRTYIVNIELERKIGKLHTFNHKIKVYGKQNYYWVVSSVDIGWGKDPCLNFVDRIKRRIITNIEYRLLALERDRILVYSNKMGTKEAVDDTEWKRLFILFVDKLYRTLYDNQRSN